VKAVEFASRLKTAAAHQPLELGAFLEITPSLARTSGVVYTGDESNWYKAEHAYLMGYEPADRIKLIDTYMAEFKKVFGYYPRTTTAWMIDTPSLKYLSEKYGVKVHELTREQWGTDSYSLYGGPPHYPYYPSQNWAMIPRDPRAENEEKSTYQMPLIVRQTITDPVWNYGDTTNSYTSQPNDYGQKDRGFTYFQELFLQAHNQVGNPYTFALLGLENSMPEKDQLEFDRELEFVAKTRTEDKTHTVVTASQFADWYATSSANFPAMTTYSGWDISGDVDHIRQNFGATWITTPKYRARLVVYNNMLYISDLRLYDQRWFDPYTTQVAKQNGYWVVPFLIDGSRFWQGGKLDDWPNLGTDNFGSPSGELLAPTRLAIAQNVDIGWLNYGQNKDTFTLSASEDHKLLARFSPDSFEVPQTSQLFDSHPVLAPFLNITPQAWEWQDAQHRTLWKTTLTEDQNQYHIKPEVSEEDFSKVTQTEAAIFFPEPQDNALSATKTPLTIKNPYAVAGQRIELVFAPRDQFGLPIELSEHPTVTTSPELSEDVKLSQLKPGSGTTLIKLNTGKAGPVTVTLKSGNYQKQETVYFVNNCGQFKSYCLTHPLAAWRYLRYRINNLILRN
jgi:hypothetical protein